jgi:hypothetical protein
MNKQQPLLHPIFPAEVSQERQGDGYHSGELIS